MQAGGHAAGGAADAVLRKIEFAFGAPRFDSVTDRSVLSSMTIARRDLDGSLMVKVMLTMRSQLEKIQSEHSAAIH